MPVTALPTAPLVTDSKTVFNERAFALVGQLPTMVTEINALETNVNTKEASATASAAAAASAQTSASNSAAAAAASSGAAIWVSGTTYAIGDARYSPANGAVYRRKTAGAGTTDPSLDTTNWYPIITQPSGSVLYLQQNYGVL